MIAVVNPGGDVMEVTALEKELIAMGCKKTGPCSERACIWQAPNGKHFSAPNPDKMYLVPDRSLERLRRIVGVLMRIKP